MNPFDAAQPEITWSLCHPVQPELTYLERMLNEADRFPVHSIEICGECHHPVLGGIHGAVDFKTWPTVAAARDVAAVRAQRELLNRIVSLCHRHGKRFYYWHREIMLPAGLLAAEPGLLDENGEFDLLGEAYGRFVTGTLLEFLNAVPDIDGLVLTLTEADYSVLHNSRPDRYPPAAVVERLIRLFADILGPRGKRLILRSFGCIPQDYEDILAAAPGNLTGFEIETKITPFDFDPFLPINPWLKALPGVGLAAEYDALGEFLGAGRLPAANADNIIPYVHEARRRGVVRHCIRLDRMHACVFDSACRINLDAFYAALADPGLTPETFWIRWRPEAEPSQDLVDSAAIDELKAIHRGGLDAVTATLYIQGNLIFHTFPLSPDPKWLKAGGIPAMFDAGASLHEHRHIWSILSSHTAPSREAVLKEKQKAIDRTRTALTRLSRLQDRLPAGLFRIHHDAWRNLEALSIAVHKLCLTVYEARTLQGCPAAADTQAATAATSQLGSVHMAGVRSGGNYASLMLSPLAQLTARVAAESSAEYALLQDCQSHVPGALDCVLTGGLRDDSRCCRSAMHASHAWLHESGMPVRQIGNPVFPNGWLEVELKSAGNHPDHPHRLVFKGVYSPDGFLITLPGRQESALIHLDREGWGKFTLTPDWQGTLAGDSIRIRLTKAGQSYPMLAAIILT